MTKKINVGVFGIKGRMGHLIAQAVSDHAATLLCGGTCRSGTSPSDPSLVPLDDLVRQADVLIDFTHPDCLEDHLNACLTHQKPIMIGTTGLDPHHIDLLKKAAKTIPVVYAANTSLGITLLSALVEKAAHLLGPEHDIEIVESHHRRKIDAPSGTAKFLGETAAAARKGSFQLAPEDRYTKREKRPVGGIGYASIRGGNIVGEHQVHFISDHGHLNLTYASTSPMVYAEGALKAALWVTDKTPGLYSMRDVLSI